MFSIPTPGNLPLLVERGKAAKFLSDLLDENTTTWAVFFFLRRLCFHYIQETLGYSLSNSVWNRVQLQAQDCE